MDEEDLIGIVGSQVSAAIGFLDSEITRDREKALEYYRGDPFGDERPDHSQVVSKDVMDTVEWILPNLIRVFCGTSKVAAFEPVGPEDEAAAEQATDYVNYVINRDNAGFMIIYTWMKDGLVQKVGIVKHWWQETEEVEFKEYAGLTPDQLTELAGADNVEIVEQDQRSEAADDGAGGFVTAPIFDVKVKIRTETKRIQIEPVPPEEFLISRRSKTIEDADFVGHRFTRTRAELIAEGYDESKVMGLPIGGISEVTGEKETRYEDEDNVSPSRSDDKMQKVEVVECYVRVDWDDDGIPELRQVVIGGIDGYGILSNEPIAEAPFTAWTPIPMPHTFWGMSVADTIMDLQLIKSTLLRGMLQNLYLTNEPEMEVVWDEVNQDDALTRRPGGLKRVNQPGMYNPLKVPFVAGESFPMLEYLEAKQQGRTGVSSTSTGIDPDILKSHQTAGAIERVMTSAQQRVDLLARMFAEQAMKPLSAKILKLLVAHQDKARTIRLRGEWVEMDPRTWSPKMDVTIDTALGTGNRDQQIAYLTAQLGYQWQALDRPDLGLVKPANIYSTLEKLSKAADLPSVDFVNPASQEGQQLAQQGAQQMAQAGKGGQEAAAYMQAEQQKTQARLMEAEADNRVKMIQMKLDDDFRRDELESNIRLKAAEIQAKYGAQVNVAEIQAMVDRERNFNDAVASAQRGNGETRQ